MTTWLPAFIELEQFGGDWEAYLNGIYEELKKNFVANAVLLQGNRVHLMRDPVYQGKEATFWHIISEGKIEDERKPELRRCERIRWPRAVIDHEKDAGVKFWKNKRDGRDRFLLFLENEGYLVVIKGKTKWLLLVTAYTITTDHQKKKLLKEYSEYKKRTESQAN